MMKTLSLILSFILIFSHPFCMAGESRKRYEVSEKLIYDQIAAILNSKTKSHELVQAFTIFKKVDQERLLADMNRLPKRAKLSLSSKGLTASYKGQEVMNMKVLYRNNTQGITKLKINGNEVVLNDTDTYRQARAKFEKALGLKNASHWFNEFSLIPSSEATPLHVVAAFIGLGILGWMGAMTLLRCVGAYASTSSPNFVNNSRFVRCIESSFGEQAQSILDVMNRIVSEVSGAVQRQVSETIPVRRGTEVADEEVILGEILVEEGTPLPTDTPERVRDNIRTM